MKSLFHQHQLFHPNNPYSVFFCHSLVLCGRKKALTRKGVSFFFCGVGGSCGWTQRMAGRCSGVQHVHHGLPVTGQPADSCCGYTCQIYQTGSWRSPLQNKSICWFIWPSCTAVRPDLHQGAQHHRRASFTFMAQK